MKTRALSNCFCDDSSRMNVEFSSFCGIVSWPEAGDQLNFSVAQVLVALEIFVYFS